MKKSMNQNTLSRRRFVARASATALAVSGFPGILKAANSAKIGLIHPVTGFLAFSGSQSRTGALMAIEDINAAGGIKSLGGAPLEPVLGDAQSKPDVGSTEVEKMNEEGVAAVIGAYASSITLATTQAAAKHGIPHVIDVGVSDAILERGLTNVFRFCPGYGEVSRIAVENLAKINAAAGNPAKSVVIVHEESLFGTGTAKMLKLRLPQKGFQILEIIKHPNPTRDFNNIALRLKARKPDLIIPANYYNEYILLARTILQYKIQPMGIYSVLGGTASSYKFLKDFPKAARYIMDCNHWFDPRNPEALALRTKVETRDLHFTYEIFLGYTAVKLLADAMERAGSTDRAEIIEALATSTWDGHFMPYGPTKFVNGQNQGARPLNTQILEHNIEVIFPLEYATAEAIFPMPTRS